MSALNQYIQERAKWNKFGKPLRQDSERHEIFKICYECINFQKHTHVSGKCSICGCNIKKDGNFLNKIAWATTRCPLDDPKWIESESKYSENNIPEKEMVNARIEAAQEVREENILNQKSGNGGCGCGK